MATLTAMVVEATDLNAVAAELAARPSIRHATWFVQTGNEPRPHRMGWIARSGLDCRELVLRHA